MEQGRIEKSGTDTQAGLSKNPAKIGRPEKDLKHSLIELREAEYHAFTNPKTDCPILKMIPTQISSG